MLVEDDEIKAAILWHLKHTHNLVEGAGAASLAAAIKLREQLAGKKVVIIVSGGNLATEKLQQILQEKERLLANIQ